MPIRSLTIFVVVMGVVIVVGFGVVLATIAGRLGHGGARPFAAAPIEIPKGGRVRAMTAEGNRLILRLSLPTGGQQILIIDLTTGARLGTIALKPAL
jgi:Family of unknown function (DUF6476)